jgi:DNA end-binding protein Ku
MKCAMPSRTTWKGHLKLSLVSVPVKAYSAKSSVDGDIHFHQLHEQCHSRIKYIKACPLHGPVNSSEIVSGYEYAKDEFVVMEPAELDALRTDKEKSVNIEMISNIDAIDRLYLTDRSSYLVPDGRVGEAAYSVITKCLADQGMSAIGRLVINGKDEVVLIRPLNGLLVMTTLSSAAIVKKPEAFKDEAPHREVSAAELKLTKTLFDAYYRESVDLSQFKDHYNERVSEIINAKISGREIVSPQETEQPIVINLMDALKKSLAERTRGTPKSTSASEIAEARTSAIKNKIANLKSNSKRKTKGA